MAFLPNESNTTTQNHNSTVIKAVGNSKSFNQSTLDCLPQMHLRPANIMVILTIANNNINLYDLAVLDLCSSVVIVIP
jgi:hypothetical protein